MEFYFDVDFVKTWEIICLFFKEHKPIVAYPRNENLDLMIKELESTDILIEDIDNKIIIYQQIYSFPVF